jgi:hypothetical protein
MSLTIDLGPIFSPWKDFGNVLKGELKRTIKTLNLSLTLVLGPTLASADYNKLMKKHEKSIETIDREVESALDKLPVGKAGTAMLWAVAPGPMLFKTVRDVSGAVSPENVEAFLEDYGFNDLKIGRLPIGKMFGKVAKGAARVGGFATLNQNSARKSEKDRDKDAETKWYTPIERLFLFQNPFSSPIKEGRVLLEAADSEAEAFNVYLKMQGIENKINSELAGYVTARQEMVTGLVDLIEQEIKDTSSIASSSTFEDFIASISKAKLEKFKSVNEQKIVVDMKKTIEDLKNDPKTLESFLKISKKKKEDFKSDQDLDKFLTQKIYEKEFSELRQGSLDSIDEVLEEIKEKIIGDLDIEDLEIMTSTVLGNDLYITIKSGLERLDQATASVSELKNKLKAKNI